MIEVSIMIFENGEAQDGFAVSMPQVPRLGDVISVDAQPSAPPANQAESDFLNEHVGIRRLKVDNVSWTVHRSLTKGDDNHMFGLVVLECSDA